MPKLKIRPEEQAWRILVGFNLFISSDELEDQFLERYFDFDWLPEDMAIKNLTGLNIFDNEEQVSLKLEKRFKHIRKLAKYYRLLEEEMLAVLCVFEKEYLIKLIIKTGAIDKDSDTKRKVIGKLERTVMNIEKSSISSFLGSVDFSKSLKVNYDLAISKINEKLREDGKI